MYDAPPTAERREEAQLNATGLDRAEAIVNIALADFGDDKVACHVAFIRQRGPRATARMSPLMTSSSRAQAHPAYDDIAVKKREAG